MVNPINVFLIDHDTLARNGLTRLLRAAHFEVQPFSSADDFLDTLGSSQIARMRALRFLVLDANTPGLSGVGLVSELKRHNICLLIVVIAANNDYATRQKALGEVRIDGSPTVALMKSREVDCGTAGIEQIITLRDLSVQDWHKFTI